MSDPFDPHAARYGQAWGEDPVAERMRAQVLLCLAEHVPVGSTVLDAGCGIGLDALALLERGYRVVAIDRSEGMVHAAVARGVPARLLPVERAAEVGPVDAALLDFGVINCLDLGAAAQALAGAVRPGGTLVLVPMPRINPAWMLRELLRLRPRGAWQRASPWVDVPVEGGHVRTRYWSAAELVAALSPWFERLEQEGLGVLLPPPGSRLAETSAVSLLSTIEGRLRSFPLVREVGDHLLLVLRRGDRPAVDLPATPPAHRALRPLQARLETRRAAATGEVRRLRVLVLHLTNGCNSACQSCDFRGPAGEVALTAEVAGALSREARALGCGEALLTGGEPLLRPDIEAVMQQVRLAGLRITLLSNGLALARHAGAVVRWCDEVVISLDGHDAESYRRIRGVDGLQAVERGIAGLRRLAPGLPIRARVTVSRLNQGTLLAIGQTAVRLGFSGISYLAAQEGGDAFGRVAAGGAEGGGEVPLRPEPEALQAELAGLRAALPAGFLLDSDYALERIGGLAAGRRRSPACDAPYTSVVVQPDLSLRPCFFLDGAGADARLGLRAGLRQLGGRLQALDVASEPTCQGCVCWAKLG